MRLIFFAGTDDSNLLGIYNDLKRFSIEKKVEVIVISGRESKSSYYREINFNQNLILHNKLLTKEAIDFLESMIVSDYEQLSLWYGITGKGKLRTKLKSEFLKIHFYFHLYNSEILIVWNGLVAVRKIATYIALKMYAKLFFAERGVFPDSWYIDHSGVGGDSFLAKNDCKKCYLKFDVKKIKAVVKQIDNNGKSLWEQPAKIDQNIRELYKIPYNKKIIFFPMQLDNDSNTLYFSPYFKTSLEVIKKLVNNVEDCYFLLVKTHPKAKNSIEKINTILGQKGVCVDDINIIDLIYNVDCVITINSTVGFEAAIRGKPVLTLGKGFLSNKDFIMEYSPDISTVENIKKCMEHYRKNQQNFYSSSLQFASYLYDEYMIRDNKLLCKRFTPELTKIKCFQNQLNLLKIDKLIASKKQKINFRQKLKNKIFSLINA